MKCVILAGGLGTRISEETHLRPKPMVELGGKPILWHIMKNLSSSGFSEFIICLGYKGYVVKEYFANYFLHTSNVTITLKNNQLLVHNTDAEDWTVTLVDTGEQTQTGGRLKRIAKWLGDDESFLFTYGDGLADIDIEALVRRHKESSSLATVSAVRPPGRFGSLMLSSHSVQAFAEKPEGDTSWISGGFFIVDPRVIDLITSDETSWELDILPLLANQGALGAYEHEGFWHAMDTLRDKRHLEEMLARGEAPWVTWH